MGNGNKGQIRLMRHGALRGHMSLRSSGKGTELVLVLHETEVERYKDIPLVIYADLLEYFQRIYKVTREELHGVKGTLTSQRSSRRQDAKRTAERLEKMKEYRRPKWAVQQVVRASGLVEDVCRHGVGHPNKDSVRAMKKQGLKDYEVHTCDGCCFEEER